MKHERRIKFDNRRIEFLKPVNVWMLDKIQEAIEKSKENSLKEVSVSFSFTELTTIRRLLVIDNVNTELCRDNILEGIEARRFKNEKEKTESEDA